MCQEVGVVHPDFLLAILSSSQMAGWEAFYSIEPFGYEVDNHRFGVLAAAIANFAGKSLQKGKSLQPSDFFPPPNLEQKPKQSLGQRLRAWAQRVGKRM